MIALRHRRFARLGAAVAATAVLGLLAAAVVTADTGSLNTLKVIGAPTYSPPVSSGSFSVTVAVNGAVDVSGAGAGLSFDKTKLTLTSIAKDPTEVGNGVAYAGWPSIANMAAFAAFNLGG